MSDLNDPRVLFAAERTTACMEQNIYFLDGIWIRY